MDITKKRDVKCAICNEIYNKVVLAKHFICNTCYTSISRSEMEKIMHNIASSSSIQVDETKSKTYSEDDFKKIWLKAERRNGYGSQEDILIEELGELVQAVIKKRRYQDLDSKLNFIEELADCYLMIKQMVFLNNAEIRFNWFINSKMERLEKRLEE